MAVRTGTHPRYSYDLFFYLGCALDDGRLSRDSVLARSVLEIREHFPPRSQDYFFRIPGYRVEMAASSPTFFRQLPFYKGRVIYFGLLRAGMRLGLPPTGIFLWLGLLPALVISLLVFFWLARHFHPFLAAGLSMLLIQASMLWPIAMDFSPDCLAHAWVLAGCFAWMEKRSPPWAWGFFFLALFTRPDTLLFTAPLGAWMAWEHLREKRPRRWMPFLPLIAQVSAYLVLQRLTGHYGWWTLFHHTFIDFMLDPGGTRPAFNPWQYRAIFLRGLTQSPLEAAPWFWGLGLAGLLATRIRAIAAPRYRIFFLIVFGGYLLHFLLFPIWWSRLLLGYHLTLGLTAAVLWARRRKIPQVPRFQGGGVDEDRETAD